jgi:hypothetical protein
MEVRFSNVLPSGNGHRYSIPLISREFHVIGEGILPNEAPISELQMSVGADDLDATGSFLLDTGAAISFISTEMGVAIGLDTNGDGELGNGDERFDSTIPIGGIGGTTEVPIFHIDRFTVPTEQGVDLVWNLEQSLSVAIVDIDPSIDGVLGADLLTSGWFTLFGEEEEDSQPGPLQQIHFDFRQSYQEGDPGTMYFDLTPEFDVVQPDEISGDFNNDGVVDAADYVWWQKVSGSAQDYAAWMKQFENASASLPSNGDFNNDGAVDSADYVMWRKMGGSMLTFVDWKASFGSSPGSGGTSGTGGVPEPASAVFVLLAACVFAMKRAR